MIEVENNKVKSTYVVFELKQLLKVIYNDRDFQLVKEAVKTEDKTNCFINKLKEGLRRYEFGNPIQIESYVKELELLMEKRKSFLESNSNDGFRLIKFSILSI